MPSWHHIDQVVFGPAVAPAVGTTGYNDLILTPYIPDDERVGVVLIIEDLTSGANYFGVRSSGSTRGVLDPTNGAHGLSTGLSLGTLSPGPAALAVMAFSGADGRVSWIAQNAQQARVTLAGWFEANYLNIELAGPLPVIPPNTWLEIPGLQAAIESFGKLVFLSITRGTGTGNGAMGHRYREPIGDPPPNWEPKAGYAGGSTVCQSSAPGLSCLQAFRTGATGLAEWQSSDPPPRITATLAFCMCEPWRLLVAKIFPGGIGPGTPPTSWTTIDLSPIFGRRHVLCAIEIRHEIGAIEVWNQYAFRPAGDTRDYLGGLAAQSPGGMSRVSMTRPSLPGGGSQPMRRLIWVESNIDGEIQWIGGGSGYGAELYLQGWVEGSVGVEFSLIGAPFPPNYQIPLSITADIQVVLGSIYIILIDPHGVEYAALEGGDWNSPAWDGTITPNAGNGYDILITDIGTGVGPGLYVVGDWTIVVQAEGTGGFTIRTEIIIPIDTDAPTLLVSGLNNLDVKTPDDTRTIRFRITDLWGFDIDTLNMRVRPKVPRIRTIDPEKQGTEVALIQDGVISSGYTGVIRPNGDMLGYDVTVRGLPDFYDPCTWDFVFDGASIVEKEFSQESLL